ncbi:MAG TPA: FG-GAP-like repeat-containing protein [Edaphobacter sp.]|nr:FG-GAP-like repeat-containing protein [Edaphobacter sp.]
MLAKGDGTYESLAPYVLPSTALGDCLAVDVNHDHNLDLVCTTVNSDGSSSFSAETLLGNGDGTFQPAIASVLGVGQGFLAKGSADFNNDGNVDLAVEVFVGGGTGGAALLLGDGTGRFSKHAVPAVDPGNFFTVADANSDGKPDILGPTGPQTLLSNGDGSFVEVSRPGGAIAGALCSFADVDGDNHVDALCSKIDGTSTFEILRGKGDGSFDVDQPVIVPLPEATDFGFPLKAVDLNHDGTVDILSNASTGYTVLLGKGNLQFSSPVHYNLTGNNYLVHHASDVADLDGDGNLDFVAAGINGIYITYGRSDGTFDAVANFTIGQKDIVEGRAADFNKDGLSDLLTSGGSTLSLSLGSRKGSLEDPVEISTDGISISTSNVFAAGDFNGDGNQDILMSSFADPSTVKEYLLNGNGDGSFTPPVAVPGVAPDLSSNTLVTDVNNDGRSDLLNTGLSTETSTSYISVQASQSDGSFSSPVKSYLPSSYSATWIAEYTVADFNQDGRPDIVVGSDAIYLLAGKGDGSFVSTGQPLPIPGVESYAFPLDLKTGDFDGDGNPDLAALIGDSPGSEIVVFYGDGTGGFSTPVVVDTPKHSYSLLRTADLDGDGRSDLILDLEGNSEMYFGITIFHALDHRTFGSATNYIAGPNRVGLLFPADFNGDGFPELLAGYSGHTFTMLRNDPGPVVTRQLTVQREPSVIDEPVTLTATLGAPSGSTVLPTGAITFSIDRVAVGSAVLSNGTATFELNSGLSIGNHRISAYWPGDANYPSMIFSTQHAVTLIPVAIDLKADPNPVTVGQKINVSFSLASSVSNEGLPLPTGTYTLLDGSTVIANGNVSETTNSYSVTGIYLPAGTHALTVNYSGDANHSAATSHFSEVVNAAPSTVLLQTSPNSSQYGQSILLTATVQPGIGEGVPFLPSSILGTVTFRGLPGNPITVPVTFPAGSPANTPAVISTSAIGTIAPGSYSVTATFSGDSNLLSSTSGTVTQVVIPPPSVTTLRVDPIPAYQFHPVSITAIVTGTLGLTTGTVNFLDGSTVLAKATLVGERAVYSTSNLAVGSHSITAVYSGDGNNAPSSSAVIVETIQPYDFSINTTTSGTVVAAPGRETQVSFTLASVGDFSEDLTLTVTNVPDTFSATLSPNTLHLDPGASAKVTLNLVPNHVSNKKELFNEFGQTISWASMLFPFVIFRRRRWAACLCALFLVSITGCGGASSSPSSKTYNVQIQATATGSTISHVTTIPITIQQ